MKAFTLTAANILFFISILSLTACHNGRKYSPAYGNDSGSGNGSGSNSPNTATPATDYRYSSPPPSPVKSVTINVSASRERIVDNSTSGTLTAGEVNDLSEWELWNDISENELIVQKSTWGIEFNERYAFIIQNKDKIPVTGASVSLFASGEESIERPAIWTSLSDNIGRAELWNNPMRNDSNKVAYAIVEYEGQKFKINNPIKFEDGINFKELNVECKQSRLVDVAFVVDATGSMGDEIDFLKKDMLDIIENSLQQNKEVDLQIGSLFYRCEGNEYVTKTSDFTHDFDKTLAFIKEQSANEGGDEVVATALDEAINKMTWRKNTRSKMLFIVLDEPPGPNEIVNKAMVQAYRDAAAKGIKIIPCVASGSSNQIDRRLEYIMRSAAVATNGTYTFFTDDSGVGDSHTLPIVKSFEVEKLNALLKRIISSNIEVTSCEVLPELAEIESDTVTITNQDKIIQSLVDSLSNLNNDSLLIAKLLPYTDFENADSLKENIPIDAIDSTQFITDFDIELESMKVYPNPSRGRFIVEISHETDYIYLLDRSGRLIYRYEMENKKELNLNLGDLPVGHYYLKTTLNDNLLTSKISKI